MLFSIYIIFLYETTQMHGYLVGIVDANGLVV